MWGFGGPKFSHPEKQPWGVKSSEFEVLGSQIFEFKVFNSLASYPRTLKSSIWKFDAFNILGSCQPFPAFPLASTLRPSPLFSRAPRKKKVLKSILLFPHPFHPTFYTYFWSWDVKTFILFLSFFFRNKKTSRAPWAPHLIWKIR